MGWHRHGDESEYMRTSVSAVRITTRIRAAIYCERHPILMGWHRHGDESEYVKTSNAKFEQLRGYAQQYIASDIPF